MIDGSAGRATWRHPSARIAWRAAACSGVLAGVGMLPVLVGISGPGLDPNDVGAVVSIVVITVFGAVPGLCGAALCIVQRRAAPRGSQAPRILVATIAQVLFACGWVALVGWTLTARVAPTPAELAQVLTPAGWIWAPGAVLVIAMTTVGTFRTAPAVAPEAAPMAAVGWSRTGGDLALLGAAIVAVYAGSGLLVAAHVEQRLAAPEASLTIATGSIFALVAMLVGCVAGLAIGRAAADLRGTPPVRRRGAAVAVVGLAVAAALGTFVVPAAGGWGSDAVAAGMGSQLLIGVLGSLLLVLAATRTWRRAPWAPALQPRG